MLVKDVMVKNVNVCRSESNLAEVAGTMWNARCGVLPVVDANGVVTSIITDRDICIALGTRNVRASEIAVKDVSLPRIFTCNAGDNIRAALNTMTTQNVRRLPVIGDNGKLVGILSIDDLLLKSETHAGRTGISHKAVLTAAKAILLNRFRVHAHEPAELMAVEHAAAMK